jgi:hypothetical protein
MHSRAKKIINMSQAAFTDKRVIDTLFQELAYNFYPERADFTVERFKGDEFSDHLYSSYPVLARRELGNLMSSNLRPQSQKWFSTHVENEDIDEGHQERAFLEHLTDIQWRMMYDARSQFVRATKQCDHDFAAFGNGVIEVSPNMNLNGMLFRNYHLRDCAWTENAEGVVDCLFRKWEPTARQLKQLFPKTISSKVQKMCEKTPEQIVKCLHAFVPMSMYDYEKKGTKEFDFISLYIEEEHQNILEEVPQKYFRYVVPRWQTVSGCQYGSSMATGIALPDGRTAQVVMRTLREAGEKYVDPPMIAIADAIRGDIPLYAGGVTIADMEYDERLGDVLRPVSQNQGGMPIGFEINDALREDIRAAFFLDKIQLPDAGSAEMTAFEVRRRLEEHMRGAAPLFEPIEKEYNIPLCELTFNIMRDHGAFPLEQMPESLSEQDIIFTFRSPLAEMADQNEAEIYKATMAEIFLPAAQIDPSLLEHVDHDAAIRDAAKANGFKATWLKDPEAVEAAREQAQQAAMQQAQMEEAQQLAGIAEQGGKGAAAINEAMKEPGG